MPLNKVQIDVLLRSKKSCKSSFPLLFWLFIKFSISVTFLFNSSVFSFLFISSLKDDIEADILKLSLPVPLDKVIKDLAKAMLELSQGIEAKYLNPPLGSFFVLFESC